MICGGVSVSEGESLRERLYVIVRLEFGTYIVADRGKTNFSARLIQQPEQLKETILELFAEELLLSVFDGLNLELDGVVQSEQAKDTEDWGVSPSPEDLVAIDEKQWERIVRYRLFRDYHLDERQGEASAGDSGPVENPGDSTANTEDDSSRSPEPADDPQLKRAIERLGALTGR